MWQQLLTEVRNQNVKAIARSISLVENEITGYETFLENLSFPQPSHLIGITGPPGAGKSTITDLIINHYISINKKVAVLCVDPSSPFHFGALLGDRIRMSGWYNHPHVYIRSLATRGSLGGLHPKIIEITDILRSAGFDKIIVETVGVGQSEVEIAGLADTTIVVLVPESGDEIQNMKAGLMEIADIFVVNKADRPNANTFAANLKMMMPSSASHEPAPVLKMIASQHIGTTELTAAIENHTTKIKQNHRKAYLLTEKAWSLVRNKRMQDLSKQKILELIQRSAEPEKINVYKLVAGL